MASIQIKTQITFKELISGIEQLSTADLERLVEKVLSLRANRKTTDWSKQEVELIQRVKEELPEKDRFYELTEKRQKETLTASENKELGVIVDKLEKLHLQRIMLTSKKPKSS